MPGFHVILIAIFIFSIMAVLASGRNKKPNLVFTVIIIAMLGLFSGLRSGIGDTSAYVHSYKLVGEGLYDKTSDGYEAGWIVFYEILNSISTDPQFMLLVTSFIIAIFTIITLRRYSSLFELETYIYIAFGCYLVTMNGIRQCVVASIIFWATKYIINKKFIIYSIIVLFLMNFHESAFIMLFAYFLVKNKAWEPKTVKIIAIGFIFIIGFQSFMPVITNIMGDSGYAGYMENPEEGANILRVIIASVPVILSYIYRDTLKSEWKDCDIFINMSVLNLMFMMLASYNWIFARFTLYFELYNVVLIPYIIKIIPNSKEKRLMYYTTFICYGIYFLIDPGTVNYVSNYIRF